MTALPEVLEKLEPCPFCGREATVENPEEGCYAIGCDDCCFSMMAGNVGIGWYATRAEAITAWNTRPALLRDAVDGWRDMRDAPFGVDVLVITAAGYQQVAMQCDISHWADRNGHYVKPLMWCPLPQPPAMHAPGGAG